jgi:hypothetical protein
MTEDDMVNLGLKTAADARDAEEELMDIVAAHYVDDDTRFADVDRIAEINPELGRAIGRYIAKLHLVRMYMSIVRGPQQ